MSTLIHLNGLLDGILDFLFGWIIDFFMGVLNLILSVVYTIAFGAFCAIIDACQYIFRIFAGTADAIYTEAGENIFGGENLFGDPTGNILFDFLMSSTVISIFVKLTVLSLFLIIIFTIVAIVKQEYATEVTKPENNKMAIVAKSGRALMSIFFIPIICIFGIYASNMILKAVDLATSNGGNSLGARIFVASSFNANRARIDVEFYNALCGRESEYTLHNTFDGYFADGATNTDKGMDIVATNVDEAFLANAPFPSKEGSNEPIEWVEGDTFGTGIKYTFAFGTPEASTTFSVNNFTVAHYYYDLWKFDYVVAAVTGIFMTFMFLKLLITLAKRIYEIILLFLASPVVASMMPLDGGNALKDWRKQFIAKIFMIYGPVVAMNLFISIFGLFTSVDSLGTIVNVLLTSFGITEEPLSFVGPAALPFLDASSAIYKKLPLLYQAYQLILCIFMCAGVMVVDQTSKWVSSWIGAEDPLVAVKENNKGFKDRMTNSAKIAAAIPGAVGAAAKATGKFAQSAANVASRPFRKRKAEKEFADAKSDARSKFKASKKEMRSLRANASEADKEGFNQIEQEYQGLIAGGVTEKEAREIMSNNIAVGKYAGSAELQKQYMGSFVQNQTAKAEKKHIKKEIKTRSKMSLKAYTQLNAEKYVQENKQRKAKKASDTRAANRKAAAEEKAQEVADRQQMLHFISNINNIETQRAATEKAAKERRVLQNKINKAKPKAKVKEKNLKGAHNQGKKEFRTKNDDENS